MKHWKLIGLLGLASLAGSPSAHAAATFNATGTLTAPIGVVNGPDIAFSGTGMRVWIDGADANEIFNVQYDMHLEYDSGVIVGSSDTYQGLVTCNGMGFWERKANGTGDMSGTATIGLGDHTARTYCDIYNVAAIDVKDNHQDERAFTVQ